MRMALALMLLKADLAVPGLCFVVDIEGLLLLLSTWC